MGIFIIGFIYNGMNLIGIGSYYQSITKGVIIIAAVLLDMKLNKKINNILQCLNLTWYEIIITTKTSKYHGFDDLVIYGGKL